MPGLIVHEWIERNGGAEKVLAKIADLLPAADILCLWNDDPASVIPSHRIKESILAKTPLRRSKAAALLTMPLVWRNIKSAPCDWAIISTHLFAHHVKVDTHTPNPQKYAYVHTPARYIWTPELDDRGRSLPARLLSPPLRRIDAWRAKELTSIAANSEFVRNRIRDTWERDASVVYPPVAVDKIASCADWRVRLKSDEEKLFAGLPAQFILGASRLVPYKMLDQVILVGKRAGLPVVIVGNGPDLPRLQHIAKEENVECHFLGGVSDELLYSLFQVCALYVFPPVEDFGIAPVEAMAAGAVVMANRVGGASETVVHGATGALTDFSSEEEIDAALAVVQACNRKASRARAVNFSENQFATNLQAWAPQVFDSSTGAKEWNV